MKVNETTYKELVNILSIHTAQNPFPSVPAAQPTSLRRQTTSGSRPEAESSTHTLEPWHVRRLLDHHVAVQSAVQFSPGNPSLIGKERNRRYLKIMLITHFIRSGGGVHVPVLNAGV